MVGIDFHELDPMEFEEMVASMLIKLGYEEVKNRKGSNDGGIDVEATSKSVVSINRIAVQCKRYADNKVRLHHIRDLDSAVRNENFTTGVIITSGEFTPDAIEYAMKSSVKIELVDGEHLVSLIKRAFPSIKSIRDILKLDLLSSQSDQSKNQRLPKSTKSNYRKIASKRDPLGLNQPNRPITVANRIDPGSSIIVDGYKVRVINQRQVQNLKLPKRDEKCPNCGMTLRGSLRYCVKDDWFFGNEKLPKSSIDKKLEYFKHHPNIELKGTVKYCFECDWEYS